MLFSEWGHLMNRYQGNSSGNYTTSISRSSFVGPPGPPGVRGPIGPIEPAGPQGIAGKNACSSFTSLLRSGTQVLEAGDYVEFTTINAAENITVSLPNHIAMQKDGTYLVSFSVLTANGAGGAIGFAVDGVPLSNASLRLPADAGEYSCTAILSMVSGETVAIQADSSIELADGACAYLTILQLL